MPPSLFVSKVIFQRKHQPVSAIRYPPRNCAENGSTLQELTYAAPLQTRHSAVPQNEEEQQWPTVPEPQVSGVYEMPQEEGALHDRAARLR
jgi:hypothetical protein